MSNLYSPLDIEKLLSELPITEKVKLLSGTGWWHTTSIPGRGIPSVRFSDGPNGPRGTRFFNASLSNCFPAATGVAATFDFDFALELGQKLADDCKAKHIHILLGPTVNTQRSPLGGRGFEMFSEDPTLNGTIAGAYIRGLQSQGVGACIKHFVANEQEYQRFSVSSEVSERALREVYLKTFQLAIKFGNPWMLMSAYNRINGLHCSENKWLLVDVLRKEWGWDGMITSDWTGVYSTVGSIKAGLDLEMPGPAVMRGPAALRALFCEKLFEEDIDIRVRNILKLTNRAIESGIAFDGPEGTLDTPETRAFLRKAAANAVVLLRNEKNLLPLREGPKRIAVIGPNAKVPIISGGGSASLSAVHAVTPLEGIKVAAQQIGAEVVHAPGIGAHKLLPIMGSLASELMFEFWNEVPTDDFLDPNANLSAELPAPVWTSPEKTTYCAIDIVDDSKVNQVCWYRFTAAFTPDEDGDWEVGFSIDERGIVFIDGKLAFDLANKSVGSGAFFLLGAVDHRLVLKDLKAGEKHQIEVRASNKEFIAGEPVFPYRGGFRIGAMKKLEDDQGLQDAIKLARDADVVVLAIGLNNDCESESFDRGDIRLPGLTDRLVSEVLAANPNVVVVNQSGTPVEMPWIDQTHTLLQAFYGGNETGNGIADVLFGKVNPASKLPLTFPRRVEDNPSWPSYSFRTEVQGKVFYNEGIFVGYKGYEARNIRPLFPFGHGLSYTSFEYSDLQLTPITPDVKFTVSCTVKNIGSVDGGEAIQVYVADPESTLPRPAKELKGFAKVYLKAGQSQRVSINLDRDALSFYDERRGAWVAEAGKFDILVASSSADIRLKGQVEVQKTVTWRGL